MVERLWQSLGRTAIFMTAYIVVRMEESLTKGITEKNKRC
jgi:hypothetical protein